MLFSRDGAHHQREHQEREVGLYEQIGRLKMELEWLKTTVVKLTREAPKAVPTQPDRPLNHDERASTSPLLRSAAGD